MDTRTIDHSCFRLAAVAALCAIASGPAAAADRLVPAGGSLQAALDAAQPGDTILLAPGATYVGNFRLPVHGGTTYVTIRTAGNDDLLPGPGVRIGPGHAPYLAKLRSPNTQSVLRTAPAAAYWRVMLVEFLANEDGASDIVKLGDASPAQNTLSVVPHHITFDRVYMHGDPLVGQKRGIHMNSGDTTIINCHINEMKAVAQDTQAIGGANGPGPYHIENNYLEAAGYPFIIGGDDPKIPGLVPSDLVFRGNTLTRPLSWRDPIVPPPASVSASPGAGGTLPPGTYAYRVAARRPAGTTTATSPASAAISVALATPGAVTIAWDPVPDATSYRVYGRSSSGQNLYWTVTTTSFVDTGAAGTSGVAPSRGTVWQVKNLFELKNFRRARVEYNLLENNWEQAQSGIAVLFSVRNQYGGCPQCVVEDIAFEYNVVRNIGGGVSILGRDYNHPSQQANNIRIRHNLFTGLDRGKWGGTGYFMRISEAPRDVVIDHNTIISPNGLGLVSVSAGAVQGFAFTNNVARHNSYGIAGTGQGYGTSAIDYYLPNSVIRRNVFAGGRASMYPGDNLFPGVEEFEAQFSNYAAGDYSLVPGSPWIRAGTDGMDLGADVRRLASTPATRTRTGPTPPRNLHVVSGTRE